MIKFLDYLNDKEEIVYVKVDKEIEIPAVKAELTFCGKNGEFEIYTEYYEPFVDIWGNFEKNANKILQQYLDNIPLKGVFVLNGNRTFLNVEYFSLVKGIIKDVSYVKKVFKVEQKKILKK